MEGEGALDPSSASLPVASLSRLEATGPGGAAEELKSSGAICSAPLASARPAQQPADSIIPFRLLTASDQCPGLHV